MIKTDLLIIGGGPAGLFLSNLYKNSLVLEKNERPGKKLLMTGGGMCNFTHSGNAQEIINHYYDKKAFVSPAIGTFPPDKIIAYFKDRGIESIIRKDNCVFPKSLKASTILDELSENSNYVTNVKILEMKKDDEKFIIKTQDNSYQSKYLAIATGGMSYPKTGSTGDGYIYAKQFGHSIIPPSPSSSEIILDINTSSLEGICVENISITYDGITREGSLVFTKRGISGPAPFLISRELKEKNEILIKWSKLEETDLINATTNQLVKTLIKEKTGLPHSLIKFLLPSSNLKISQLSKTERKNIVNCITKYKVNASTKGLLKFATATRGGINTREIDKTNFESKLVENLFFIGEVLDVDGECGGYNLNFAFSSAYNVFKYIKSLNNQKAICYNEKHE